MLEKVVEVEGKVFEILGDGFRVWVNGPDGGSVARFNNSIDIHRPASEHGSKGQCLYCTRTQVTPSDWPVFVSKMKELYGVEIPDEFKPDRFL